jgi:hypothetical protein
MKNLINILLKYFLVVNTIIAISAIIVLCNHIGLTGKWILPVVLLLIILFLIIDVYIYVVLTTSFNLPYEFDQLKNKIASGQYKDIDSFQKDIADFLINNFNHPGADIKGGVFSLKGAVALPLHCDLDELPNSLINGDEIHFLKVKEQRYLYIPVFFNHESMGYILLQFSGWILPYTKSQLSDFIENYLDDQLAILLRLLK